MSDDKTAVIIGSGIAGMAAAIRLAVLGFKVDVYESNAYPGGKLSMFEKDGYRFDAGPSLFTQPQLVKDLFDYAGVNMDEYFRYKSKEISCRYFFEDGKIINGYANAEKFAAELEAKVAEPAKNVITYLDRAKKLYHNIGSIFLNFSLHKKKTWFNKNILTAIKSLKWPYLFESLNAYNHHQFQTSHAQQIFNRYATYNGSDPYRAPAMLSLIPHLEINDGTYYPEGGMVSITNALYNLAKHKGVQFHFNTSVQRIIHRDNECEGVVLNDMNIITDIVVSNADVYFSYKNLLQLPIKANDVLKQERSSSALIFYWGISQSFSALELHNIFFSQDYQEEFKSIFKEKGISNDPTIYINITSKEEKEHAPPGKENWFVMVNVPANTGQDWPSLIKKTRKKVISKLSRMLGTDVGKLIESETTLDPLLIESRTGSYMGSLYGTSSNSRMAAFLRHPNFTTSIKNLYHCGGSVHPGGGIPLCLKSAQITTDIIAQDFTRHNQSSH